METVSHHRLKLDVLRWTELSFQTWSTIIMFIFTVTLFPDKQEKAQQEIDAVVGHDRLPEFSDRSSLPYVDALLQEVLR
jgi:hypothetical protein